MPPYFPRRRLLASSLRVLLPYPASSCRFHVETSLWGIIKTLRNFGVEKSLLGRWCSSIVRRARFSDDELVDQV